VRTSCTIAITCICQRAWHVAGSPDMAKSCVRMRRGEAIACVRIAMMKLTMDDCSLQEQTPLKITNGTSNGCRLTVPPQVKCHECFDDVRHHPRNPLAKSKSKSGCACERLMLRHPSDQPPSASCLVPCLAGVHHLLIVHDRLPTLPTVPTYLCTCILQLRRPFVTYRSAK
jgi:hypothetical protein